MPSMERRTLAYILILVVMSPELIKLHWLRVYFLCITYMFPTETVFWDKCYYKIKSIKSIIHQVLKTTDKGTDNSESPEALTIYARMSYYSDKKLSLLKSCLWKIWSNCIKIRPIRFKTQYVNKFEFYYNTKDETVVLCLLFIIFLNLVVWCQLR